MNVRSSGLILQQQGRVEEKVYAVGIMDNEHFGVMEASTVMKRERSSLAD
jgi:hypothetical protein